jgi:hypothetical protein
MIVRHEPGGPLTAARKTSSVWIYPGRSDIETLAKYANGARKTSTEPEYSRSGAGAQRREEEISLSEFLRAIIELFAAPLREYSGSVSRCHLRLSNSAFMCNRLSPTCVKRTQSTVGSGDRANEDRDCRFECMDVINCDLLGMVIARLL